MEDTRITLRDTRNNDRSSDRAQQLGRFFLSLSSSLRSRRIDRRKSHPIEFPFRGRVRGGCTRYSRFYVPRIRTCRGGVAKTGWNWKGASSRGRKFGVNWGRGKKRGSESGGGTVSGRWQFYGNADICITRAPTRYRRVCKPAFLHLMYTFHVAANCTGRRKDSRASARRYYVTCRSIMIPPLR